jgi:DNA-binding response OmpR family regulator
MTGSWDKPPVRVLIVEDDPDVSDMTGELLKRLGFAVASTDEPLAALAATHDEPINLVVADIHLPKFSGLELARELRANGIEVPILFVSGDVAALDEALAAGLERTGVLAKPYTVTELNRSVWETLRSD